LSAKSRAARASVFGSQGECCTSAVKKPDGSYAIKGTKIFISGGDHDLTENNIHLVLARIEGAAAGTKGLSLFVVPKLRVNADGTLAGPNDVTVASIEHKMGINGSPTCVLNFGEDDACQGFLCGTAEHQGMRQMFQLMNDARILVGNQGVAAASSAYLNALAYAKERRQGAPLHDKNPDAPRALIIEHPDVRRMLLDMKAKVEGIRALGVYMTGCQDRIRTLAKDDPEVAFLQGQVDLMVPLYKAYGTDQGFQVCATAIQTYGGAGYLKDHPVEQNCRDAKIFAIYEGTNHIQALDLVGRKLRINNGQLAHTFAGEVNKLIQANATHPRLGAAIGELGSALAAGSKMLEQLGAWAKEGKLDMAPLAANRVLEGMSELAVGWLLLQGAVLSLEQADKLPASHPDRDFYEGKVCAAIFFAHNVLPGVAMKMKTMQSNDRSALEIPAEAF
jgi:alkylation response protein AidB-like acyl-CoA dehydrogenase